MKGPVVNGEDQQVLARARAAPASGNNGRRPLSAPSPAGGNGSGGYCPRAGYVGQSGDEHLGLDHGNWWGGAPSSVSWRWEKRTMVIVTHEMSFAAT
ncbi:hypothetical protein MJ575_19065 [Klebsiella pneumoniae]|nr:hypothetical protein MJ575_19065 [Klebsiella pneumoniae]